MTHFLFTAPRYHTNQHFAMKALLDAGHQVTFLALGRGKSEVHDSLEPTILPKSAVMRTMGVSVPSPLRLWSTMRRLESGIVVVRNPNSPFGLLSVLMARVIRCNVVFYSQTPMHRRLGWYGRFIRSFPARVARARWITPVLGSPDAHPPAFGALRYVPFVMEPQTCPEQKQWFRDGVINLLSVGKFQARKHHRMLLWAISDLSERFSIRATIVGECTTTEHQRELRDLEDLRSALGLSGKVCFKTNLSYWDVHLEYARHDLFVLPSRDEPAAVSHLEAMSHSLPVICSDSNGTQYYIRQGENGYVFRTDDLDHLEECMEGIISNRARLIGMGARSYELVVSEHSPAKYVERMVSIADGRSQPT